MDQPQSDRSFWLPFSAITVIAIIAAAVRWSLSHPYGIHWDEASYMNEAWVDAQRLRYGMILKLAGRLLVKSFGRPPAYRLLADPFLAVFGPHATVARLVSLACFALTCWFIYLAARRLSSKTAGAFAVLVFCLSPEVVSASIFFGTDAPLYLAVSAMLYYLFVIWRDQPNSARNWVGLGLSIGLGFLSKTSFAAIALPVLAFWFVVDRWGHFGVPGMASLRKAGTIALFVAGPWWVLNIKSSLAYAGYARDFVRNSLGPPSLGTWMRWLSTVFQGLLGHGVSILIGFVLLSYFVRAILKKETILDPFQKVALGACACAGVPIVLAQLSGTNHLLRHITPAVVPLAIVIGVLADRTGWAHQWATNVFSGVLFGAQALMLVSPVVIPNTGPLDIGFVNGSLPWRTMIRFDQWDWKPVQEISDGCGLTSPKIAYLGGGREFDPPAMQYPWVTAATATRSAAFALPDVTWLWRYEDGPLDWSKVMSDARQSDIVLTAPHYVGEVKNKEDLDNHYNADFADRLSRDAGFGGPVRIKMGRFEPVEMDLFLRKSLVCRAGQGVLASAWSGK